MNLQLKCIISHWECSGQGDGGFINLGDDKHYSEGNEEDATKFEFGAIRNRPQCALNQQKYFTNCKGVYLLYLFEMLEKLDLLGSSTQCLNSSTCASNGNSAIPLQIGGKHKADDEVSIDFSSKGSSKEGKKNDIVNLTTSIEKHGEFTCQSDKDCSFLQARDHSQARESSITSRIDTLHDMRRNLIIRLTSYKVSTNKALHDVIAKEVEAIDEDINGNLDKCRTLHDTPQKSNCSPN